MKKRKWSKIFLILYVICVLSYTAARIILKEYGYFYYDFFEKGKMLLLLIGAVYIWCIGVMCIILHSSQNYFKGIRIFLL